MMAFSLMNDNYKHDVRNSGDVMEGTFRGGNNKKNMSFVVSFVLIIICCQRVNGQPQDNRLPSPSLLHLSPSLNFLPTNGPIHDAQCTIEDLEQANDSQLYSILMDLRQTNFFNNFVVDLSARCPLQTWRKGGEKEERNEEEKGVGKNTEEDDEFVCPSSKSNDLDPGSESLCTVTESNPFSTQKPEQMNPFDTNTFLFSLSKDGFQSKDQQQTFEWKQQTDMVIDEAEATGATISKSATKSKSTTSSYLKEEECGDDKVLPDSFWMDMCTHLDGTTNSSGTSIVNLSLNPEHNTGYNGTHIWKAIYEENCAIASHLDEAKSQCLEERVLYRMLSGLHTSTTVSIAKRYNPPSVRKNRKDWEANATYFYEKLGSQPDYIRNLHFSYVVLLRALQKASPLLLQYEIRTGDIVQDETATVLLRRLLDSALLTSCQSVFFGFDETKMWQNTTSSFSATSQTQNVLEKEAFKGIFHNISLILDCVQCQQCKLHGKMSMLGYGTALRILFTSASAASSPNLNLGRNEIVALINTLAKLSESVKDVRELTHQYLEQHARRSETHSETPVNQQNGPVEFPASVLAHATDLADVAMGLTVQLARNGNISSDRESELVRLALARQEDLLLLAKHYGTDLKKFLHFTHFLPGVSDLKPPLDVVVPGQQEQPDAIIIGSGLAGLTTALNILDRGGNVVIIEKEHLIGGNSNKASSGINGCCFDDANSKDSVKSFEDDTIRSAGTSAQLELIETLVNNSGAAVSWLRDRVGIDLSLSAQLGGHTYSRTRRPKNGMVGAEIIYGVHKAVKAYEKSGKVKILTDSKVVQLLTEGGNVVGVKYTNTARDVLNQTTQPKYHQLTAPSVVLATGGFAADRSEKSFMAEYRPDLLSMATTAGDFSTGDGISLATSLGAGVVDMDKIQIHPTGWVDPKNKESRTKVLAAELMRGVGGILINRAGKRFCNELGTRAYVTEKMLTDSRWYGSSKSWPDNSEVPTFFLILSATAAEEGRKHVDLYTHKGLMTKLIGLKALAEWMGIPKQILELTFSRYQKEGKKGRDQFGKTYFPGLPTDDLDGEIFYAGMVTPVLHYCMGGVTIDSKGHVLDNQRKVIPGLRAVGEVSGGVHGHNRLAGNSLLECTVFGTIVGQNISIASKSLPAVPQLLIEKEGGSPAAGTELALITKEELARHNKPDDCWVAINSVVYDLTTFAPEHPAGAQSIYDLAGKDGTEAFEAVHNQRMLEDLEEDKVGMLLVDTMPRDVSNNNKNGGTTSGDGGGRDITLEELKSHRQKGDCWVAFHGQVYNMSTFAPTHPGGEKLIFSLAGSDGTNAFDQVHSKSKLKLVEEDRIGTLLLDS